MHRPEAYAYRNRFHSDVGEKWPPVSEIQAAVTLFPARCRCRRRCHLPQPVAKRLYPHPQKRQRPRTLRDWKVLKFSISMELQVCERWSIRNLISCKTVPQINMSSFSPSQRRTLPRLTASAMK